MIRIALTLALLLPLLPSPLPAQDGKEEAGERGLLLGAYGELLYSQVTWDRNSPVSPGELNVRRLAVRAGYPFENGWHFYTEARFSPTPSSEPAAAAGGPAGRSVLQLEQAYLEKRIRGEYNLRFGLLPVPVGLYNRQRRPVFYHGNLPPNTERYIIPAPWQELGAGLYGHFGRGWSYRFYLLAGLDPSRITGEEGIRPARQGGPVSRLVNPASSARIGRQIRSDLSAGISYYFSSLRKTVRGDTVQKNPELRDAFFDMISGDFRYTPDRFRARGLIAVGRIPDVFDLNDAYGGRAGRILAGGYVELAWQILPWFDPRTEQELWLFCRYESYDTNFRTAEIPRTNAYLRDEITAGLTWRPLSGVSAKADYQLLTSFVGSRYRQRLNAGLAFSF